MSICTEKQQEHIISKMSSLEKAKFATWSNKKELGLSQRDFKYFERPENEISRTLDF